MVKRLIGGLVLLNLCAISLDVTAGEVDITDSGVLEQLKELRTFIDVKRDFSKESKQLKPVLVQYRNADDEYDGVVQCNMGFNTDALHLSIGGTAVLSSGDKLTININVEYEYTEYVGYTIKTAKLNVLKSGTLLISTTNTDSEIDATYEVNKNLLKVGTKVKIVGDNSQGGLSIGYGEISVIDDEITIICTPLKVETESDYDDCSIITINESDVVGFGSGYDGSIIPSDRYTIKIYLNE